MAAIHRGFSSYDKTLIEKLDGEKVVSRRKGFTTTACTAALAASRETPEFQFIPVGEKMRLAGNEQCIKAETQVCFGVMLCRRVRGGLDARAMHCATGAALKFRTGRWQPQTEMHRLLFFTKAHSAAAMCNVMRCPAG